MKQLVLFIGLIAFTATISMAQVKTPQPSPKVKVEQDFGLSTVTLEYSRPGVKDRTIFGDLVGYDKMWRTGANKNSMVTFSDKVTFGGTEVEPGTYALFTKPGATEWEVYLYTDTENWGTPEEWSDDNVAAKVMAKPMALKDKVENFTISLDNLRNETASLCIAWDHVGVMVPLTLATDEMVMATIEKTMAGPGAGDLYNAARYYRENGKDLDKALVWMKEAIAKRGELFWNTRQLSLIQADLGDYKGAIKTAEKSLALSKEAEYDPYIKANETSIAEWKKMK